MATPIVSAATRRKAEQLADRLPYLPRFRSKANGAGGYVVPSSTDPVHKAHYSNHLGCTCEGFRRRSVCTHQLAALIVVQRAEAAIRATTQPVQQSAQERARRSYADLHPECSINGCDELALGKSGKCSDHLHEQQWAA
jgi:hypothetical protein